MDIYKKIETLYSEPKSKGFITHLLRSFFPVGKATELMGRPENTALKCCITGATLCSKDEKINFAFQHRDIITENTIAKTKNMFSDTEFTPSNEFTELTKSISDMKVAVSSPNSDKYLSEDAYKELYNFYATQILRDNKHVVWIAKNEMVKNNLTNMEKSGTSFTQKEKKVVHKAVENSGGMSLGEMEILKNLKNKFKD